MDIRPQHATPALWGGVECTVNRVGDRYFDQLERSGHTARLDDLDRFSKLGIRALRFPVLWERTAPLGLGRADWRWPDAALERLAHLDIEPIIGLIHHGSGPRQTSLLDPTFPERLAAYAAAVARRYPWVGAYTPVNEPLTTARFSALYGHWYPHAANDGAFARALLNQCRAIVLATAEIRRIHPGALLIQTEDLGKTFSTPATEQQADFENQRRWLSFDLLCGRVSPRHPMWEYLRGAGVAVRELEWFRAHATPPDVLGLNYYLTSERFLDHRAERYPAHFRGGNGRQSYADVEAVRVRPQGLEGPQALLMETWERYRIALAVTEVHNGCTREEQMRWFLEVWDGACAARAAGADLRAVTAWALLGSSDWHCLVTRYEGRYEVGAFDIRGSPPRLTAVGKLIRACGTGEEPDHPVLDMPGWWRRTQRLTFAPASRRSLPRANVRQLLIAGAGGTLGQAFVRQCRIRGLPAVACRRSDMDITDREAVAAVLDRHDVWAVVNTAGYVRVDDAERERERCMRENAEGPAVLAEICGRRGLPLVTFSSDLVFDGSQGTPYHEESPTAPLNVYGASKADAERRVLATHPEALVVRTSAFFGPHDDYNVVTVALQRLLKGDVARVPVEGVVSPTYVPDLVDVTLDLLIDGATGLWHVANAGAASWAELARLAADRLGLDPRRIITCPAHELGWTARRPAYSALTSSRGCLLPPLGDALARYVAECTAIAEAAPAA
jgi:dTDP-4-dehydrorhamnose reductase